MKTSFYLPYTEAGMIVSLMMDYIPTVITIDNIKLIYVCSSIGEESSTITEQMIRSLLKGKDELIVISEKLSAKEHSKAINEQVRQYKQYSRLIFKSLFG